jgi:hypothetical protein
MGHIYGDLGQNAAFAQAFTGWLTLIYEGGLGPAIDAYLAA